MVAHYWLFCGCWKALLFKEHTIKGDGTGGKNFKIFQFPLKLPTNVVVILPTSHQFFKPTTPKKRPWVRSPYCCIDIPRYLISLVPWQSPAKWEDTILMIAAVVALVPVGVGIRRNPGTQVKMCGLSKGQVILFRVKWILALFILNVWSSINICRTYSTGCLNCINHRWFSVIPDEIPATKDFAWDRLIPEKGPFPRGREPTEPRPLFLEMGLDQTKSTIA